MSTIFETPAHHSIPELPKRVLSYSDLKRKRHLRSNKSAKHISSHLLRKVGSATNIATADVTLSKSQFNSSQNRSKNKPAKTERKKLYSNKPKIEESKACTDRYVINEPIEHDEQYLDLLKSKVSKSIHQYSTPFQKQQKNKETNDLIKKVIMRSKSQRKLLDFRKVRDQIKKQKSISKQLCIFQQTIQTEKPSRNIKQKQQAQTKVDQSLKKSEKKQCKFELVKKRGAKQPTQEEKFVLKESSPYSRRKFHSINVTDGQKSHKIIKRAPSLIDIQKSRKNLRVDYPSINSTKSSHSYENVYSQLKKAQNALKKAAQTKVREDNKQNSEMLHSLSISQIAENSQSHFLDSSIKELAQNIPSNQAKIPNFFEKDFKILDLIDISTKKLKKSLDKGKKNKLNQLQKMFPKGFFQV